MQTKRLPLLFFCLAGIFGCVAAAAQLYVQNGASITCPGGVITLQNIDLINNGVINQSSGSGKFVFTGTSDNHIGGNNVCVINQLYLSRGNGSRLLLDQDLNIGSSVQFNGGLLDLNNHNLYLQQPTTLLVNENEGSHLTGLSGGAVHITDPAVNAPSQYNAGGLGVAITSLQNLGSLTVTRSHMPVTMGGGGGAGGGGSIQRNFFIAPTNNSGLDATLRFYYLDADLNGNDKNSLVLWKSMDGNTWNMVGADTVSNTQNFVEKRGIADFSYWTLSGAGSPLPLVLLSFQVVCDNGYARVKWVTASEQYVADFVIEKSLDGSRWAEAGSVKAHNIYAGDLYEWEDKGGSDHGYYRLKITNQDRSFSYSPVFSGGCGDIAMPFAIYPNPAENQATARISVRQNVKARLVLADMAGGIVEQADWDLAAGVNSYPLSNIGKLAAGVYLVRIFFNGNSAEQLLIKK